MERRARSARARPGLGFGWDEDGSKWDGRCAWVVIREVEVRGVAVFGGWLGGAVAGAVTAGAGGVKRRWHRNG